MAIYDEPSWIYDEQSEIYDSSSIFLFFFPPTSAQVGPITDYFGNTPADADPLMLRMAAHLAPLNRGVNVYLMNDGTVTQDQPPNWDGSTFHGQGPNLSTEQPYAFSYTYAGGVNPPNGVTTFTNPPALQVKTIFWGGVNNPVTAAEGAVLVAAGYELNNGVY